MVFKIYLCKHDQTLSNPDFEKANKADAFTLVNKYNDKVVKNRLVPMLEIELLNHLNEIKKLDLVDKHTCYRLMTPIPETTDDYKTYKIIQ